MKKFAMVFALIATLGLLSCGHGTAASTESADSVDTVSVDSVDTVSVDSVDTVSVDTVSVDSIL